MPALTDQNNKKSHPRTIGTSLVYKVVVYLAEVAYC